MDIHTESGVPLPLGMHLHEQGVNFALFSKGATKVTLCLFSSHPEELIAEIPLDPEKNRTGWVWHILLNPLPAHATSYGYRVAHAEGRSFPDFVVSDPYAKGLTTSVHWGKPCPKIPKGKIVLEAPFDWQEDKPPNIPLDEIIIYEMHVRSFTKDPSSGVVHPGTFLGIIEKIPHLKRLGVNAIELMPIFEFDEWGLTNRDPKTNEPLPNVWGYSTINFFSLMNRYATSAEGAVALDEFRLLVREMHKAGIEVYLDVVYNHTAEGNDTGKLYSFRGIDDGVYYILNGDESYANYSGTGNTFNANHTVAQNLILASLRYFVQETHVDGFRFDLASCLTRDEKGAPMLTPPVIQAISHDPVLAQVKLIAEAWDAGGLYQVGNFPGEGRWLEWNGEYRDRVRRFIKGTDGSCGPFAESLSGSADLYGKWKNPLLSVNFVTAHDGFSLRDLVSYQEKHNWDNGEGNRDGANNNESWNCGAEGLSSELEIVRLRQRQMRNFHCALLLSIGTPMLLMGDEYGHTRLGNNNPYCQDNALNWFLWEELEKNTGFFRFYERMIHFRKACPVLRRGSFLTKSDIDWHGHIPLAPNWGCESRFLAYTLKDSLYVAFNAQREAIDVELPEPPKGKKWFLVVDTALPSPHDFCDVPEHNPPLGKHYKMQGYSTLIVLPKYTQTS